MKPEKSYRFNFPILRWILVLFLATGISEFSQTPQQTYKVETVDFSLTNSRQKIGIVKYIIATKSSLLPKIRCGFSETIKLLSLNLSNNVEVILKRQTVSTYSFSPNTIRQFLIRNCVFPFSEDLSDFMS